MSANGSGSPAYEYRFTVTFDDTSAVGNVYFSNYIRWQGHCREQFLRDHASDVVLEIAGGLQLVTTRLSCEYYDELVAFDQVLIRMSLGAAASNRVGLRFDYFRLGSGSPTLVARSAQEVACMRRTDGRAHVAELPASLINALVPYASTT